ncbi:MAG TPA: muconolactone Delta-isomerase family protein [Acidimicrobiales bacterium]|jgi:muconolactone D-isomerase|nr:muconolactone Delta-isomerase family protein [Acidimicrobiales bacterium]
MEFLTNMITHVPDGTDEVIVEETKAREAKNSAELARQGHLLRLWKPPVAAGEWRTLGLWEAADEAELTAIMATMPLHPWMTVEVTPLTPHPSDPGIRATV